MTIEWSGAPPVEEFANVTAANFHGDLKLRERPLVIRGLVAGWPLVAAAQISEVALCEALSAVCSDAPAPYFRLAPEERGRVGYNGDFTGFNFSREAGTVRSLLSELLALREEQSPPSIYAGALRRDEHFPMLAESNPVPFIDSDIPQPNSVWLGNRVRIAAHWDLARNLICVIGGRRRYILIPPTEIANLYVGPVDFTPAGQPMSLVDFHAPDLSAFPRFRQAAAAAMVAELVPGDALYIPSLWFHHAETLSPVGAMVNCWWRDAPVWMTTPLTTLMHGLLTIRDLPRAEREAWRAFFNHYLFDEGAGALDHIPASARGAFGEMTEQRAARLRAMLVQRIGWIPATPRDQG